jgi:hypothetical protein
MRDAYTRLAEYANYLREGQARAREGEDMSTWTDAQPNLQATLTFVEAGLACAGKISSEPDKEMFIAYLDAALTCLK